MGDWLALLKADRFRGFWLALLCNNLGSWSVTAALPILVAYRFGAGGALVLSLGLRILPKIVLAPVCGVLLRRFGPARVASRAMVAMAVLTAVLPWCEGEVQLQALIAVIGTLDVFIMPGLLSLRGTVTPKGHEMAGNTLCSVADRSAKIVGPTIGGFAILAGFEAAFLGFAAMILLSAIPVSRLPSPPPEEGEAPAGRWQFLGLAKEFVTTLKADAQLLGLVVCAVTYMVMLGGLRPFLFWANRDWYGATDAAWTGLLAAQGFGALIGAVLAGAFNRRLARWMSAYTLTLVTGVMEGVLHLGLLFAGGPGTAMVILALASIPEIISTASWFTTMQQRLSARKQTVFFTFSAPLWDCAHALGVMSAGFHAGGSLSLSGYWMMISLTATLPLVPLLVLQAVRPSADVKRPD